VDIKNQRGFMLKLEVNIWINVLMWISFFILGMLFLINMFDDLEESEMPASTEKRDWNHENED